jgi:DegV family protein with EDD domain
MDVELMEFPFIMDDGEHFDDFGFTMDAHTFYDRLRKGEQAHTAQIPYGNIVEVFERMAQSELPTVFLCFTSGLSGTYESIEQVCEETKAKYPDAELYVVDTLLASVAEGMLVWEAVRQADAGLSAAELVAWVSEARYFVNAYFTLPDLESLRRGGRVPDMAAFAGAKLDIKPILSFDLSGHLCFHGAARGRKKAIKQLLQFYFDRRQDDVQPLFFASADAPKELKGMEEQVVKMGEGSVPPCFSMSVGPVIGAHVGPDMLALTFWGRDRREDISLTDRIANAVSGRAEAIRARLRSDDNPDT